LAGAGWGLGCALRHAKDAALAVIEALLPVHFWSSEWQHPA